MSAFSFLQDQKGILGHVQAAKRISACSGKGFVMNWYQNPYFGKTAEKRKYELMQKIDEDGDPLFIQLITLAPGLENQMEILSAPAYRRQVKRKGEPLIIGIACGMREAKELTAQIVGDVYRLTGTANVRRFFEQKQETFQKRKESE